MIHDATGKFSSRWVLPDRNSLARVIGNLITWFVSSVVYFRHSLRKPSKRIPHIGEYARKTNLSVMSDTAASWSVDHRSACGYSLTKTEATPTARVSSAPERNRRTAWRDFPSGT